MRRSVLFKSLLCALALFMLWLGACSFVPVSAEDSPTPQMNAAAPESVDTDSVRFYTFIDNDLPIPPEFTAHRWWQPRPHRGPRPMVQWFVWANKPKPFLGSLLFILFFAVVLWSLMPRWLQAAETPVRSKFWSTFFIGILIVTIALTVLRVSVRSLIGWPLGIMTAGVTELALLSGLSLVVSILGQRTAGLVRLSAWPVVGKRESVRRFAELLIGSLICALLLQIPPIGPLPRIGTRILCMLAIVGLGALYRARSGGEFRHSQSGLPPAGT